MNLPFALFPSTPWRRIIWLGMVMLSAGLWAQVPDELEGDWLMDDGNPALNDPANKNDFTILRASPGPSTWADGAFFLKWPNEARPERGYYSLKTKRVWVTTYRWVNQKEERVEYTGIVSRTEAGRIEWKGMAKTTGVNRTSWNFIATRN